MVGEKRLNKIGKDIGNKVGNPILYDHYLVDIDNLMVLGIERFQELFEKYLNSSVRREREHSLETSEGISKVLNGTDPNFIENLEFYIEYPRQCCDYHNIVHTFERSIQEDISDFLKIKIRNFLYQGVLINFHSAGYSVTSPIKMLTTDLAEGYIHIPFFEEEFFSGNDSMFPSKIEYPQGKYRLVIGENTINTSKKIKILEEAVQECSMAQDVFRALGDIAKEGNLIPLTQIKGYSIRDVQEKILVYLGLAVVPDSEKNITQFAQGIIHFLDYLKEHSQIRFNVGIPFCSKDSWSNFSKKAKQRFNRIEQIKPLFDSYRDAYETFKKDTSAPIF